MPSKELVPRPAVQPPAVTAAPPFEQPILSALELIVDEHGDQVERWQALRLRVAEPRVEHVGHAGEAQRAEGAVEFDLGQEAAPRWAMRSR